MMKHVFAIGVAVNFANITINGASWENLAMAFVVALALLVESKPA